MNEPETNPYHNVLSYPSEGRDRLHGPRGYADYRAYKPWLRDEFTFRCVYCLIRERWFPTGHEEFAVDHNQPRSSAHRLINDYNNLLYACASCNRNRQDSALSLDPLSEPLAEHLRVTNEGIVEALTKEGRALLKECNLNRKLLVRFRDQLLRLVKSLVAHKSDEAEKLLFDLLGFPDDLPDLSAKRPPGGNDRPRGVRDCHYERRKRGQLPRIY